MAQDRPNLRPVKIRRDHKAYQEMKLWNPFRAIKDSLKLHTGSENVRAVRNPQVLDMDLCRDDSINQAITAR